MTDISQKIINNILVAKLSTISNLPALETENTKYTKTKEPWVRSKLEPTRPVHESEFSKGLERLSGLLLVDLFYPKGTGVNLTFATAQNILDTFPPGATISSDGHDVIIENSYFSGSRDGGDAWIMLPVTIQYYAFVQRII